MPTVRLAGVNDEPSPTWDLDEGLDVLEELGIRFVELRAAYDKMVDAMDDDEFTRVADRIIERGFQVTTYLGQMGQCVVDEAGCAQDLFKVKRAVERTDYLGARQIRLMGYKKGKEDGTDWKRKAMDQFQAMTDVAAAGDKVMIFENPPNLTSAICRAHECREVLDRVQSPHLRHNLDPGNFGSHGEVGVGLYETLKEYVVNVHVKDIRVPDDKSTYCPAGEGICCYPEILGAMAADGFDGIVTVEPHMTHTIAHHTTGRKNFIEATEKLIRLLEESGFEVQKA